MSEESTGSETSTGPDTKRAGRLARGGTEFLVIFVGVVVALAADRWITGADERAAAAYYRQQLVADVRADSTLLEDRIAAARSRAAVGLAVLRGMSGQVPIPDEDAGRLASDFKLLGAFSLLDYNRSTWDEMVSSGRVSLVEEPELRRALASYYDDIESFTQTEIEWDVSLRRLEEVATISDDPIRHLVLWGAALRALGAELPETPEGNDFEGPGPGPADLDALLDALRRQPAYQGHLAQARLIWSTAQLEYSALLDENSALLRRLAEPVE